MIAFPVEQLLAHVLGDYVLQSDWMATEKSRKTFPALLHATLYALPFYLWFRPSWDAVVVIAASHYLIDRFRLARFVCYAKNFIAPPRSLVEVSIDSETPMGSIHVRRTTLRETRWWRRWGDCTVTGYDNNMKEHMSFWLFIAVDNLLHVLCNAAAISLLTSPVFSPVAWLRSL